MNDRNGMTHGNRSIERALDRIETRLDRMSRAQKLQLKLELKMSKELDDLTAAVAHNTDVENSAITLLQGLKAQLDAAGTDPVKLAELSASLGTSTDALAAAITANTPTVPPPATI